MLKAKMLTGGWTGKEAGSSEHDSWNKADNSPNEMCLFSFPLLWQVVASKTLKTAFEDGL